MAKCTRHQLSIAGLLERTKKNLIVDHALDDELLERLILAAVDMAAKRQNKPRGYYLSNPMPPTTEQAVIMYASHLYESRDGSTGGFFGDRPDAAAQAERAISNLLALDKEWKV